VEAAQALARRSEWCHQYVDFGCRKAKLLTGDSDEKLGFWVSSDGVYQNYWGGAEAGLQSCACGIDNPNSCVDRNKKCNCDAGEDKWNSDEGYLNSTTLLPVVEVIFKGVVPNTEANYSVGHLYCAGESKTSTFVNKDCFIKQKAWSPPSDGVISFFFKTPYARGILLYKGVDGKDFFQLEIVNETSVGLWYNIGNGIRNIELSLKDKQVNDLSWHHVVIYRNMKVFGFKLDNEESKHENPLFMKRNLDVSNSILYVGRYPYNITKGFVGFIRGLEINGEVQDLRRLASKVEYVASGCGKACENNACKNNGKCFCDCSKTTFYGYFCHHDAQLCLGENSEGVLWSNTSSGGMDLKPCPNEGIGMASRYCSEGGKWNPSNFTKCRSAKFIILHDAMDAIFNGGSPGNDVGTILSDLEDTLRLEASNNSLELQRIFGGDLIISVDILSKIAEYNRIHGNVSSAENFKKFAQAASHLLEKKNGQAWKEIYDAGKGRSTILVETMDDYGLGVAATFGKSAQLQFETDNLLMRISRIRQNSQIRVEGMKVTSLKSSIYLPSQVFSSSEDSLVVSLIYQTLNEVLRLSKDPDDDAGDVFTANTSIVSSTVSPEPRSVLSEPIFIVLENKQMSRSVPFSTTRPSGKCLFWRPGEPKTWNTRGCWFVASKSNLDVTTCECNHLTVFAALMDPYGRVESKPHTQALELISTVGCSISLLAVSITLVVHLCFWRVLKSPRSKVLLNLCAAVAFTCALVISEGKARNKVILCTVVAALLHYFLLALFSWMLCEGMLHYMLLVRVLRNDAVSKMNLFYTFGWGFPALVVAISLIITRAGGYGGEDVCWLNVKNGLIWAFIGPALLVISVNIVVFVLVLKKMMGTVSMQSKERFEQVKAGVKASAVILPLLGITWLFGLLSFNSDTIAFKYIFSIFNSLQGLTLFVFHCVFNRQVKDAVKLHQQKRKARYPFKSNHVRGIQEEIPPNKAANHRLHQNPKNNEKLSEITDFDYGPKKPSAMKNEKELTCAVVHRIPPEGLPNSTSHSFDPF
ncbi:adhesion G protein-coupled receptor L4-like, partial [Montipora capricornis]|uniref:adhesion G protein-coupled receptor L4-like n=1 Tax=Montipora capricornis TaxID=246305 RepID=UPI0035F157F0